jgi:hypothetical protein
MFSPANTQATPQADALIPWHKISMWEGLIWKIDQSRTFFVPILANFAPPRARDAAPRRSFLVFYCVDGADPAMETTPEDTNLLGYTTP